MTQIIEVIIAPNGHTKIEAKGFVGPCCRDASRFLEEALGTPTSEQLTAEFHQVQPNHTTAQQQL